LRTPSDLGWRKWKGEKGGAAAQGIASGGTIHEKGSGLAAHSAGDADSIPMPGNASKGKRERTAAGVHAA